MVELALGVVDDVRGRIDPLGSLRVSPVLFTPIFAFFSPEEWKWWSECSQKKKEKTKKKKWERKWWSEVAVKWSENRERAGKNSSWAKFQVSKIWSHGMGSYRPSLVLAHYHLYVRNHLSFD